MRMTYAKTINHTLDQLLEADPRVILLGQGTTSPWYVGTTTEGLIEKYGPTRIIDTPISENAVTGMAAGIAIAGMKPICMHPRQDFLWLAMDAIANQAANWHYMSGGKISVPLTIWAIVNRGGEQAAQHSQAIHSTLCHIPGLKVVAPSNPESAKGLLAAAVNDPNPVVFIDDRWLYKLEGEVSKDLYETPIGKAHVAREGSDITIVTGSWTTSKALQTADKLNGKVSIEVIDLQSYKPLDIQTIETSIRKTGRAIIVDAAWKTCGLAGEIIARIVENNQAAYEFIKRLTLPDAPAPASRSLEEEYFISSKKIEQAIRTAFYEEVT